MFNIDVEPATTSENLGIITLNSEGFNGFTEYSIDGGNIFFFDNVFTGLNPGVYDIIVRDEIGCQLTGTTTVDVDCSLFQIVDIIKEDIVSDTELGSIEIIVSGDTNVLYSINGGNTFSSNNIFNNLNEGEYNIVVKNSLDCIISGTIINIDTICDLSIENFTYGSCLATGFLNRNGSSLSVINNELILFMRYNFEIDNQYNRYFREKITITETNTSQVILEKWVDFVIPIGDTIIELGNIFVYLLPTYSEFDFSLSYSNQTISCTPFTEPVPSDIFNPLPEEPTICVESYGATMTACFGGTLDEYMEGFVLLNEITPTQLDFELRVDYIPGSSTANCSLEPTSSINLYVSVEAGQTFGSLNCNNGAQFIDAGGATICNVELIDSPIPLC